jgi:cobalt-zinc-cadmium efflux system outer membrane protein
MKKSLLLLALLVGCASGENAPAENPSASPATSTAASAPAFDASKPLSLEESVRAAESSALNARTFQARLQAARATAEAAAVWPNPTFTYHTEDVGLVLDHQRQLVQQEIVSYPILFAWTKGLENDVARADLAHNEASIEEDKRQLRLSVGQAFLELLASDEVVKNQTEAVGIATKLAEAAATRQKLGDASALEEKRARGEALEAQRDLQAAVVKREVDGIAFALALGAEKPAPVTLASGWPLELPAELAAEASGSVAALVDRALAARADVRAAEANVLRASKSVDLEGRKTIPLNQWNLSVGVSQGPEGSGGVLVEASGPVPVFDWNQGNRARARAELEQALADQERTRRAAAFEVEAALLSFQRLRRSLDEFARPITKSREEAFDAARRLFAAGEVGYVDLLQAQRDAVAARKDLVDAEKDAAQARWKLIVALGRERADAAR